MPTLVLAPTFPEDDGLDGTVDFLLLAAGDAADQDDAADGSVRAEELSRETFGPGLFFKPKMHARPCRAHRVQLGPPPDGPLHFTCTWERLRFRWVGREGSRVMLGLVEGVVLGKSTR